ncbi:MAG: ScyD/ScyE family protein [Vicinamibacterales bacterium]
MMRMNYSLRSVGRLSVAAAAMVVLVPQASTMRLRASADAIVTQVVGGLNDPRGIAFSPTKRMFVAEAGSGGGTLSTVGLCDQVAPPVGAFLGGHSGRVLEIMGGEAVVVADRLPSAEATAAIGGDKQGVADVAFFGNRVYALLTGAGCSHGHAEANNGIIAINADGDTSMVADLSAWLLANPGAKGAETPRNPDYEPDGTWYSMITETQKLYAVEPNHGLLVSVKPSTGIVTLVKDLFATFGDNTYTSLASDRGDLYVGTLGRIAFVPGVFPPFPDFANSFQAGVYRLSPNGDAVQVADGLHAVLGLAFDRQHRLYVLQSPIFIPGTGSLLRIDASGNQETLVSDLIFPSSLTRGPDDAFYVSECGYHCNPGDGRILRIAVQ